MFKGGVTGKITKTSNVPSVTEPIDFGSTQPFHSREIQNNGVSSFYNFSENEWLTVADGNGKQDYTSVKGRKKKAIKWGQLKLFITELQFLNKYWNESEVAKPTCVYVGAAPGHHIAVLANMFPQVNFELYDARNFDPALNLLDNVKTFVQYFTTETAEKYKDRNDIFFISDIRSLEYNKEKEGDEEIIERLNEQIADRDMRMQMEWVQIIKPFKAHLKFRLPYAQKWVKGSTYSYLDGDLYKQPFAPLTSTEARLVVDLNYPLRNWDFRVYEKMMFYHNNVIREHIKFVNPLTNIVEPISEELGLLMDYDSVVFAVTVREYLEKFGIVEPTAAQVLALCKYIIEQIGQNIVSLVTIRAGGKPGISESQLKEVSKLLGDEDEE